MKKRALIFDLDGTLLDTIGDLCDAVNDALKEIGVPLHHTKEDCCRFIGNGVDAFMHRALKEFDNEDRFARLKAAYLPKYKDYQGRTTEPFVGMKEVLQRLKDEGVLLFVCTNKPHALANIIVREKIGDLFTEIYGQIEGEPVKPNPHIINYFVEKYGLERDDCRMIGDSLPDVEIAENAGIRSVLCTWGYGQYTHELCERAWRVVRRPDELLGLFARRLYVFDIDQTLVPRGSNHINDEDRNAINALLERGDAIALASGRPFCSVKEHIDTLADGDKYLICANGGVSYDQNGVCLSASHLHLADLYHFKNRFLSEQVAVYGYDSNGSLALFRDSYFIELEELLCHVNPSDFVWLPDEMPTDFDRDLFKVLIAADPSISSSLDITESEKNHYMITRSDPMFLEVVFKGIDKASRADDLRKRLGIPAENVYCFGDSGNDMTMIKNFHGIAMGNATDDCKAVAEIITKTCDECGVAYALKEILHAI